MHLISSVAQVSKKCDTLLSSKGIRLYKVLLSVKGVLTALESRNQLAYTQASLHV